MLRATYANGEIGRPDQALMRAPFALLWLSETALDFGSALMSFALGVWIFQTTGSAERFSHAVLAAAIPALVMTPIAGTLADRFDRRRVIVSCDMAAMLMIAVLAWLLFQGRLVVAHLLVFNAASAVINSIRTPAYRAAVSVIVPKDRMTQASGLIGTTQGVLQIGAPLAAGSLMGIHGITAVVGVDVVMVVAGAAAAFSALSLARHAMRGVDASERLPVLHGAIASFSLAIRYFQSTPVMVGLAAYAMLQEGLVMLATAMLTPLVLSTQSSDALGLIMGCGALGGVVGSLMLLVMRINKGLMTWVLTADVALSLFIVLAGFSTSTRLWCVCAFFAFFAASASGACAMALWMRKTPKDVRGSIFALNASLQLVAMSVAVLVGASLGEHVFEPALSVGGAWANTIGAWVGTGKGRGLGFLFIVSGGVGCLVSLLALTFGTGLRRLDALVPDQPDEDAVRERRRDQAACATDVV